RRLRAGEDRMTAMASPAPAIVSQAPFDSRGDAKTRRAHWSVMAQGRHTESPLPLGERDRVRGLAALGLDPGAGAEESIDGKGPPHVAHRLADSLLRHLASAIAVLAFVAVTIVLATPAPAAMDVQEVTSLGGIKAWLIEEHSMPLISVGVGFHGGWALDPKGKDGLATFASATLDEGAGDLESREFQQRLNDLAIDFKFDANIDDFTGTMRTLSDRRDQAFDLLRLALTAPRFDAEPVERIRGQLLAILADDSGEPGSIADRVWWHAAFPDHPYGRQTAGTAAGLKAITAEDLRGFVKSRFARDKLIIGVV